MKTKLEILQSDFPEIDFSKVIDIPSVESLKDKLVIELEIKD